MMKIIYKLLSAMAPSKSTIIVLIASSPGIMPSAFASDSRMEFGAELSAGFEYSSKVAIDEIDTFLNSADLALLLGAELNLDYNITPDSDLTLNYSLSDTRQDDLSQFDLRTHFVSLDYSYDVGPADIGIAQRFTSSSLGGSDFMAYRQTAPYATALLGSKVFLRAELGFAEKDFDSLNDRDADVVSVSSDWFFFLNGTKTYLMFRYAYADEDAVDPDYDYEHHSISLRLARKFNLLGNKSRLRLEWRLQDRSYANLNTLIGEARNDQRQRLRATLDLALTDRVSTEILVESQDVDSNFPDADRASFLAAVQFKLGFGD